MSGHSKWSTIKRKKEALDQKRGVVFTKLAKVITLAVRRGGSSDPDMNFSLRLAIDRAGAANMPKGSIQRAIKRGSGKGGEGEVLKEAVYEGFGPKRIAILVETLTDNTNRTVSELKKIFEKRGGSLASSGSVSYLFQKSGLIVIEKTGDTEEEMLKLIDLGVEDIEEAEDAIEAYVKPGQLASLGGSLTKLGFKVLEMEIVMRPKALVKISDKETAEKILAFIEGLSAHDDVQKVWTDFDYE